MGQNAEEAEIMKMKRWIQGAAFAAACMAAASVSAADTSWSVPLVGRMTPPAYVTFAPGEQQTIAFLHDGGPASYFKKHGISEGDYYHMTYADPPNFSYGWASAQVLGVPFLLEAGLDSLKTESMTAQMDGIAAYLNDKISDDQSAVFQGSAPLSRINDSKNPRWEGSFTMTYYEKGITYRETYLLSLQITGYRIVLFTAVCDASRPELADSLRKMISQRSFWKDQDILHTF